MARSKLHWVFGICMTINSWYSHVPVVIAKGGTNATSMTTANGIVKYNGTRLIPSTTALIDTNNIMTNTSQPSFLAYLSADTGIIGGKGSVGPFDTNIYDVGNNFTIGANALFTAPKGGKYLFTFVCTSINATGPQQWRADIIISGATFTVYGDASSPGNAVNDSVSQSIVYPMALGDTMQIFATPATYNFVVKGDPVNICTYVSGQLLS